MFLKVKHPTSVFRAHPHLLVQAEAAAVSDRADLLTSSRCVAYGGLDSAPASTFIYVTNDVQKGADSSWVAAKLPALREDSKFRHVAFAPGSERGWAVGAAGSANPLVLETSDGGATWKDVTATVRALAPNARLHAVYAFDDAHVWIGGDGGTLFASGH